MKSTDEVKQTDQQNIITDNTKTKLSKRSTRIILVTMTVLTVLAVLVYLKPEDTNSEPDTQYYSDIQSSVPVFDVKSEDESDVKTTHKSTDVPVPDADKMPDTVSTTVINEKGEPDATEPTESYTDAPVTTEVQPESTTKPVSVTESQTNLQLSPKTNTNETETTNTNYGSTELAAAPEPVASNRDTSSGNSQFGFVGLDADVAKAQDKMLEEMLKNKNNTITTDQNQHIEYKGIQQTISYVEGEQTKVYMYKNFAVKIFLGQQPNNKQITNLDYFINGSDENKIYTVRLLKRNTLLLSKERNDSSDTWGGTDLFITAGDRTYTFIILHAPTPSERTDSIRFTNPIAVKKK